METSSGADSGGRAFRRAEESLRHLLTTCRRGDILPPQRELAVTFGVSRYTVQRVLKQFTDERLISSRQGSGIKVLKVPSTVASQPLPEEGAPVMLGPLISRAFEQPEVSLDVYTLTSESLVGHVRIQAERIIAGQITPDQVTVRLMLPAEETPLAYPRAKDPADPRIWERWRAMARQRQAEMRSILKQLPKQVDVRLEIRKTPLTPAFKLYVLNSTEMLHGPYKVIEWDIPLDGGTMVSALDVLGLGSPLFFYSREEDDDSQSPTFFSAMRDWFESHWTHLGEGGTTG